MNKGYKPKVTRELLNLEIEKFRYWRNLIDPSPKRTHFTASNILAYRVIKSFVSDRFFPVKYLSKLDWKELFLYFENNNLKKLKEDVVLLDKETNILSIKPKNNVSNYLRNNYTIIFLNQIIETHIKAFTEYGDDSNVITLSDRTHL